MMGSGGKTPGKFKRCLVLSCLAVASCAGFAMGPNPYVQPQNVLGPCHVKTFFIVALNTSTTEMTVDNTGQACVVTMFNPDLQVVQDGALITERPAHGQVWTELLGGDRVVDVTYRPLPGYAGPDRFNITFEPAARDVTFNVTVRPADVPARPG